MSRRPRSGSVPVPLVLRLPFALALIAFAAWRGERWLLPIGVLLAMPVIWWGSLALLVACVALKRDQIEDRVEAVGEMVREEMIGAIELSVPLVVDVGVGANWDEAH